MARVVVVLGDGRAFTNRGPLVEIAQEEEDVGVTSITAGTGLSGGTITSTGTIAIDTATTVDKTTAQELTNKTIVETSNTMSLTPRLIYSEVELGEVVTVTSVGASYTVGTAFVPTRKSMSCVGMRFWWDGSGSKTIKCTLWNNGGSSLQTVNVAATTAGIYTATWGAAETLTAFSHYRVSVWVNDASAYKYLTAADISTETGALMVITDMNGKIIGPGVFRYAGCYAAGDAYPTTGDAANLFMTEPTFAAM